MKANNKKGGMDMYDTSSCPYFSESCPVCDDGECGCFECLERIEELKEKEDESYE